MANFTDMRAAVASLLAACCLAGTNPGARADIVELRWSSEGRFSHQGLVAAGKYVEICGKLPAQLQVQWNFEASAPLDFNVHYHVSKEVAVYPYKLDAVANAKDTLTAKIEQDYCWMWSNKSTAPAELRVSLQR
jgi:hypothetical protein